MFHSNEFVYVALGVTVFGVVDRIVFAELIWTIEVEQLFFADSCVDVEMLCHCRHGASSGPMVSRSAVLSYAVMPVTMT